MKMDAGVLAEGKGKAKYPTFYLSVIDLKDEEEVELAFGNDTPLKLEQGNLRVFIAPRVTE